MDTYRVQVETSILVDAESKVEAEQKIANQIFDQIKGEWAFHISAEKQPKGFWEKENHVKGCPCYWCSGPKNPFE